MRAAVTTSPDQPLDLVELADPAPGPGELLLAVDACGICGSDLHLAQHLPLPGVVLGHELCGTVVAVGEGVDGWSPGRRAAGLPLVGCGRCVACLDGRTRKCVQAQMVGLERPGAFADLVLVGARESFALPDEVDDRLGALVEPLAVALHAVVRSGTVPGDDVLVVGGGPVGLAVVLWLAHLGARSIVVSDPVPARRAMAERVGATATLDPGAGDVATAFADATGSPARHVIECVGVPGLIQHAIDVVAVDGTVTVTGVCFEPDQLTPLTAMTKELDVRFAFFYANRDFATTIALLAQGRLDAGVLVTDEIALDDLPARFELLKSPTDEVKVLIRP